MMGALFPLVGYPAQATAHSGDVDRLMLMVHGLMFAIFAGWMIYGTIALMRFRRSRNPKANPAGSKSHGAHFAEIAVVAIEAVLLVVFSIPFWSRYVVATPGGAPIEVRVVAQQYAWNIHYPGPDGVFGRTAPELVDDANLNSIGLDRDDPAAADDIVTINELCLPVNRPVVVRLTSKDVIHSFNVVEFRVKRDAIPGMVIDVPFTPTLTTAALREMKGSETRDFEIACAQLCGLGHYRMRGIVRVVSDEEFADWLVSQAPEEDPFAF